MNPYFQTTPFTTAASSLLTILHHFNPKVKLTKENEFKIWRTTVVLPTRASSIYALANYAQKCGLSPKIIVEKRQYNFPDYRFYKYKKEDIDHAVFSAQQYLKEAEQNNIFIKEKEITLKYVKKELQQNRVILLRLNTKPIRKEKRNTSNYLVVHGYKNKRFYLIDPAAGAFSIPEETMKEAFHTLETKKYRDHRMIIFER